MSECFNDLLSDSHEEWKKEFNDFVEQMIKSKIIEFASKMSYIANTN